MSIFNMLISRLKKQVFYVYFSRSNYKYNSRPRYMIQSHSPGFF